jgi:hypothetical protein
VTFYIRSLVESLIKISLFLHHIKDDEHQLVSSTNTKNLTLVLALDKEGSSGPLW